MFLVECVPFLSIESEDADGGGLHPAVSQLLDGFGQRKDVLRALGSHIYPYYLIGSEAGHHANQEIVSQHLKTHARSRSQRWGEKRRREVLQYYREEKIKDAEKEALRLKKMIFRMSALI